VQTSQDDKRQDQHFLGRIVHDLRTPLGQIMGFSELIQHEAYGPLWSDHYKTYIEIMREAGGHMLRLIDEILAVEQAKSQAGKSFTPTNLSKLSAEIVNAFSGQAAGREQTITFIDQTGGIDSAIDPLALRRVMNNLISNACKYAGVGATIDVVLSHAPNVNEFCIEVLDDGPGIPDAILAQIGKAFVDGAGQPGAGVSGLGLSNVAKFATTMGCVLSASARANGGASVAFYMPAQ
ncbi:MAG: sensor histidine kinase, partial [Alphaproteobacteria bacterium]